MKILLAGICLALLTGCSRPSANQQTVEANTPINFALWRSKNSDLLTPKEWALFDQAMEEFKFQVMLSGQASGSEAIDNAVRAKIDGMKLTEAIQSGLQSRLKRLQADKSVLEESLAINSRVRLKPDDDDKAAALAAKLKMQTERLEKMNRTVSQAESDLKEFEAKFR